MDFLKNDEFRDFILETAKIMIFGQIWDSESEIREKSFNFFLARSKTDSSGIRFRRPMATALNAENEFPRNSFPGDLEISISGM